MKKILITGADGFIGRNLVRKLLSEGKEVYGIVYPGNNIYENARNDSLHVKPMDLNQILNHVREFPEDIDTIYHFAWVGVKPEQRKDTDVQLININMTMECMKFAKRIGVGKVIFPGSTNEYLYYGRPINKDAIPTPSNAYGAAKTALRYLCSDFAKNHHIGFVYAIIAGIYAADRRDNNVIFYTIDRLLRGEKPSLTKLEQKWDYVNIEDAIEALFLLGEKGRDGMTYAVGHGDNWELNRYIKIIHEKINPALPMGIGDIPYDGDILPSSCIDLTDIEADTGYRPKVDFEEGIMKVIESVKKDMEAENAR